MISSKLIFICFIICSIFAFGCDRPDFEGKLNSVCNDDATCDYPTLQCSKREHRIVKPPFAVIEYICVPKQATETVNLN